MVDNGRVFCLDFDNAYLENGLFFSLLNITIDNYGFHGKSAYFNGLNSFIEVPAVTNMQFSAFGISLWFRQAGDFIGLKVLADNGRPNGSLHISAINQTKISAEVRTSVGKATVEVQPVSSMMLL